MKIGMLFPDYGSQFVGMGKELYDNSRLVQEYFEEAFNCLNINFVKLCFASSEAELAKLENAAVSIFLISVATAALLKQENIVPTEIAGYGIGEVSAICAANGLTLPDGLYFLNKYAQFYQELLTALSVSMLRIEGISALKIAKLCKAVSSQSQELTIASYDMDMQQVISGYTEGINLVKEQLSNQSNAVIQELLPAQGLHSSLMDPVVNHLLKYTEKIDFNELLFPLIATVDGSIIQKKELVKRRLIKQLHTSMHWNKVLQKIESWDLIIEVGPGTTLSKMIKKLYPNKNLISINRLIDIEEAQKAYTDKRKL